jgi:presenilin-like A22 family membrane protease
MIPTQDKPDTTRLQNLSVEVVLFVFASFFSLLAVCVSDECSVETVYAVAIVRSAFFQNYFTRSAEISENPAFYVLSESKYLFSTA